MRRPCDELAANAGQPYMKGRILGMIPALEEMGKYRVKRFRQQGG